MGPSIVTGSSKPLEGKCYVKAVAPTNYAGSCIKAADGGAIDTTLVETSVASDSLVKCKATCESRGTDCTVYQFKGTECKLFNIEGLAVKGTKLSPEGFCYRDANKYIGAC
jgi:hypothetical protein